MSSGLFVCCRLLFSPSFNICKSFFQYQFLHWIFLFFLLFVAVEIFAIGPLQQLRGATGKFPLNFDKCLVCVCANVCVYEFSEYVFVCIKYFPIGNFASFLYFSMGGDNQFVCNFWQFFKTFAVTSLLQIFMIRFSETM